MTMINLLPWRELKREQDRKHFLSLVATMASIIGLVLLGCHYAIHLNMTHQTYLNEQLKEQITLLTYQMDEINTIKKQEKNLISRMETAYDLQASRFLIVHLFDELVNVMPDDVFLTNLKREGRRVTLQGYSQANTQISGLMQRIQENAWMHDPVLTEIKKANTLSTDNSEFSLSFTLRDEHR